jgi:hypothetical protein
MQLCDCDHVNTEIVDYRHHPMTGDRGILQVRCTARPESLDFSENPRKYAEIRPRLTPFDCAQTVPKHSKMHLTEPHGTALLYRLTYSK